MKIKRERRGYATEKYRKIKIIFVVLFIVLICLNYTYIVIYNQNKL